VFISIVTGRLQPGSRQVGPACDVDESNCWDIVAIHTDSRRSWDVLLPRFIGRTPDVVVSSEETAEYPEREGSGFCRYSEETAECPERESSGFRRYSEDRGGLRYWEAEDCGC